MKKLLLTSTALAVFAAVGSAGAADLPVKAPPMAPIVAPVYNWTGFYVGAGVGFRESHTKATSTVFQFGTTVVNVPPLTPPSRLDAVALRVSPYVGYNWQVAPRWVIGVEGDVGIADRTATLNGFVAPVFETANPADSFSVKTTWDASVRARAGFLVTPTTLLYGTGGAAWQHYEVTSTCAGTGNVQTPFFGFGNCGAIASPAVIADSVTRVGWTAGGGLEAALWGNWIARGEYRYADFGTRQFSFARSGAFAAANPTILTGNVALSTHTATFGLAYKFGDPIAAGRGGPGLAAFPTKAQPAAMSWSGFYVGLGAGVRASEVDWTTRSIVVNGATQPLAGVAASQSLNDIALRGSPYLGLNWQVAPQWVVGIEGDVGLARKSTTLGGFPFSPAWGGASGSSSFDLKTTWDASARARIGFLVTPTLLVYATGGVAWQHFDATSTTGAVPGITPPVIVNSADKVGGTVGGGLETALSSNWFARAEYRYADFGTSTLALSRTSPDPRFLTMSDTSDLRLHTHTVMFGIAYKLDWIGPVIAKY